MRVRFGDCVFDAAARELARKGRRTELSPKAFRLLEALLAARPRALSRAELNDRLRLDTSIAVPLEKAGIANKKGDVRLLVSLTGRILP